jgi:hypothetical protein
MQRARAQKKTVPIDYGDALIGVPGTRPIHNATTWMYAPPEIMIKLTSHSPRQPRCMHVPISDQVSGGVCLCDGQNPLIWTFKNTLNRDIGNGDNTDIKEIVDKIVDTWEKEAFFHMQCHFFNRPGCDKEMARLFLSYLILTHDPNFRVWNYNEEEISFPLPKGPLQA